jgi:hypothetical protein
MSWSGSNSKSSEMLQGPSARMSHIRPCSWNILCFSSQNWHYTKMWGISRCVSVLTNGTGFPCNKWPHVKQMWLIWHHEMMAFCHQSHLCTMFSSVDRYQHWRGNACSVSMVEENKLMWYHIPEYSNHKNCCQYLQSLWQQIVSL